MSGPLDGAPGTPLDGAPGAGAGRTVLVTGASSGIGWHAARRLAALGARVLLGSRDADRGERAAAALRARVPGADVSVVALDLADLRSVRAAADDVVADAARLWALTEQLVDADLEPRADDRPGPRR